MGSMKGTSQPVSGNRQWPGCRGHVAADLQLQPETHLTEAGVHRQGTDPDVQAQQLRRKRLGHHLVLWEPELDGQGAVRAADHLDREQRRHEERQVTCTSTDSCQSPPEGASTESESAQCLCRCQRPASPPRHGNVTNVTQGLEWCRKVPCGPDCYLCS